MRKNIAVRAAAAPAPPPAGDSTRINMHARNSHATSHHSNGNLHLDTSD